MTTENTTKPVITEDQLDGTTRTLLLIVFDALRENHVKIDRDTLQLITMSALVGQVNYEQTKELFTPYITFIPREERV